MSASASAAATAIETAVAAPAAKRHKISYTTKFGEAFCAVIPPELCGMVCDYYETLPMHMDRIVFKPQNNSFYRSKRWITQHNHNWTVSFKFSLADTLYSRCYCRFGVGPDTPVNHHGYVPDFAYANFEFTLNTWAAGGGSFKLDVASPYKRSHRTSRAIKQETTMNILPTEEMEVTLGIEANADYTAFAATACVTGRSVPVQWGQKRTKPVDLKLTYFREGACFPTHPKDTRAFFEHFAFDKEPILVFDKDKRAVVL